MNIWLALGLSAVVGIAAYNTGFKQGLSAAPARVEFEAKALSDDRRHALELAKVASERPFSAAECLEAVVSADFDLFGYCEEVVSDSQTRDDEARQSAMEEAIQP